MSSMLRSRDRRRFERAAARARRPSRRSSIIPTAARLALWSCVVGIALAGLVMGARGFYAYRSSPPSTSPEVALGGKPAAAPEPVQESEAARPADSRQARATDARQTHLRQLQPVLRTDAERLAQIAKRVRADGRVTDIRKDRSDNAAEL